MLQVAYKSILDTKFFSCEGGVTPWDYLKAPLLWKPIQNPQINFY